MKKERTQSNPSLEQNYQAMLEAHLQAMNYEVAGALQKKMKTVVDAKEQQLDQMAEASLKVAMEVSDQDRAAELRKQMQEH